MLSPLIRNSTVINNGDPELRNGTSKPGIAAINENCDAKSLDPQTTAGLWKAPRWSVVVRRPEVVVARKQKSTSFISSNWTRRKLE